MATQWAGLPTSIVCTWSLDGSIASLGRVVGPAWGGYFYDAYGMTTPYLSAAGLMFTAFVVSLVGLRSK